MSAPSMWRVPQLVDFLEEQVWALRDRTRALKAVHLPRLQARLGLVTDELDEAALILRRATGTDREGLAELLARLRRMVEAIEREAWPARAVR